MKIKNKKIIVFGGTSGIGSATIKLLFTKDNDKIGFNFFSFLEL